MYKYFQGSNARFTEAMQAMRNGQRGTESSDGKTIKMTGEQLFDILSRACEVMNM